MNDIRQLAQYSPQGLEDAWYARWEAADLLQAAAVGRRRAVRDHAAAAERDRRAAHGALPEQRHPGRADPLDAHARPRRRCGSRAPTTPASPPSRSSRKMLRAEGLDKHAMGREAFLERAWVWKRPHPRPHHQPAAAPGLLAGLAARGLHHGRGALARRRPRLRDPARQGLIVRDLYLVNWCPHCLTAISDDEVDHREVQGSCGGCATRWPTARGTSPWPPPGPRPCSATPPWPCTPTTPNAAHLIGRRVRLPLTEREIPIIGDHHADPEKGTGFVKITPAHDPNDFEVGRRHDLPQVVCMDERGVMNEAAGVFAGLDRFAARKAALAALQEQGLSTASAKNVHQVGHHDRCGTIIEPYLSRQWFLRMRAAGRGGRAGRRGRHDHPAARALGRRLPQLAAQHPRLVHLPAALVGPPHPGLELQRLRPRHRRQVETPDDCPGLRLRRAGAGPRRAGHLVLQLAVDLLAAGLAARTRRTCARTTRRRCW